MKHTEYYTVLSYNPDLVMALWEIFPDSYSITKPVAMTETYNGPFGTEEITVGTKTESLALCILNTANAIMIKWGIARALRYIDEFRPASVQRTETAVFLR